jgi:hypothetical protein
MATINNAPKTAYVYDEDTSSWYAIGGSTNTVANYTWSGTHNFQNVVTFEDAIKNKAGVNNFTDPAARDAALPVPVRGLVCFVKQDASAVAINQLQFYDGTSWKYIHGYTTLLSKIASYEPALDDAGKTITFDSASNTTITVPPNSSKAFPLGTRFDVLRMGTGLVTFVQGAGVTILSKNSNKNIASRWSGATIVKTDTNTWVLIGDLIA